MRSRSPTCLAAGLLWVVLWVGCAQSGGAPATDPDLDPIEPFNRGIFWFNEKADQHVIEPVAEGWDFVVPQFAQTGLENFFRHIGLPVVIANDILQLKPQAVGHDLMRLFVNTIFGLGGFIDVASREGIDRNDEGFGETMGYWGMPPGPYLVVPFLGPSTPRQLVGLGVDSMGAIYPWFVPIWVGFAANGVELLNLRAKYLEEVAQNRAEAFDYYVFIRNAYLQNLEKRTHDLTEPEEETEDDLYYYDDEDFE